MGVRCPIHCPTHTTRHILLTGATGFIGQTLHAALRAAGHQVHAGVSPRSAQAKPQP
ncbi:MAG: NAD-dependent epimerase/dehydratase family protein, partial [Giesbergeria sp.]